MKKRLSLAGTLLAIVFFVMYLFESKWGKELVDIFAILRITATSALVAFIVYMIWNLFIWRLKFFVKIHHKPVVSGTWATPSEMAASFPFNELKIRQSFDGFNITLKGKQFTASSLVASLIQDETGSYIYFVFFAKPKKRNFRVNEAFYGTMRLHCQAFVLIGEFYTSNNQQGQLEFYRRGTEPDKVEVDKSPEPEVVEGESQNEIEIIEGEDN